MDIGASFDTTVTPGRHTDPVCEFFSKNYLMAKLLQNNSNLNDFEYSRHLKTRKIEKKMHVLNCCVEYFFKYPFDSDLTK